MGGELNAFPLKCGQILDSRKFCGAQRLPSTAGSCGPGDRDRKAVGTSAGLPVWREGERQVPSLLRGPR